MYFIILNRKDLRVKSVQIQKIEKNPLSDGYDVRLDVYAEDSDGNHYNIEIQRADEGADRTRARFNSAVLDQRMLKHKEKFKGIKASYVIFITENDVLGKGRALSHIERTILEDNEIWNDGNHIIYANAAYQDTSSDIGKLMHDFRCRNAEDMFYKPLSDGVRHFKETKGGRDKMSKDIEQYADEKATNAAVESAIKVAKAAKWSDQQIIEYLKENFKLEDKDIGKYFSPVLA